ncbi:hypothetical protein B7N40_24865 [Salmonella enterica subsp. enterica serovar Bovismorbificans]|nr:hypothetical protein [Salmonella enterica subsp. enterica serovar Bovismorbificans]
MTPLKEMYERLAELQAKEKRFSEEESEIAELNTLIATREKYLQRYINHPPHMVERVSEAIMPFAGREFNEQTRGEMLKVIVAEVHSMVSLGQIFGRADQDDMIFFLEKALVS